MMNLIDQRTTPDGLARLARPWRATVALALALLAGTGTAAAQDAASQPVQSAWLLGTKLTLAFDKPVVIGTTSLLVEGFTVDGISNSGSVQPSAMTMDNRTATLELGMGAEPGQTVTVSYDPDKVPNTPPSPGYPNGLHEPLRYTDGTLVPKFSGAPVTIGPNPATDLSVLFKGGKTVELSWTYPAQPAGAGVPGVRVTAVEYYSARTKPGVTAVPDLRRTQRLAVGHWQPQPGDVIRTPRDVRHGGTTHYYRVRLVTNFGDADSEVVSWTSDQEDLKPATGLTASNATQTTVDLAWTLPAELPEWATQIADELYIAVEQEEAGLSGAWWRPVAKLGGDAVAHTVTGLSPETAYSFRIRFGFNTVPTYSEPVSVTTLEERAPLTAAFHEVPAWHGGKGKEFSFELRFSENFPGKLPYKKLRDEALSATNGRVTGAKRAAQGQNQRWTITVRPHSSEDVIVTLAATTDCGATGAICTPDGRPLSNSPSATVVGPSNRTPLTAAFHDVPTAHGGKGKEFSFELRFSENFPGKLPYKKLKDEALSATNGRVTGAKRVAQGQNQRWTITVRPRSSDTVTVTLAATTDCSASGAICTPDGRPLSNSPSATIDGPSAGDANGDVAVDSLAPKDEALAVAGGLSPDEAAAALFGERVLSEARQAALDRLGNGNGRYDLGDVLSWIERCQRGEARCGPTSADAGPVGAAALLAAVRGRGTSGRRRGQAPEPRRDAPVRRGRRRGSMASYAVGVLLAVIMTWSCTDASEGPVAPAATELDPGFLTVELAAPAGNRDRGVLLELEGPAIEAIQAAGLELYESRESGQHQVIVAGSLAAGPLMQFRVPDRNQLPLYRVRVLQVTDEDYGLRDADEYRAVLTH
ncbi:MAG: fibronectin type III domain-containing protein [Gemmatimonadetes bacterium]|nr:fibronectin type III domain-containing protein [Gemmatimonadales bacterium]MYC90495.1 fibronectin type III domain-containing protein [Gemmatimonadota bacterium]